MKQVDGKTLSNKMHSNMGQTKIFGRAKTAAILFAVMAFLNALSATEGCYLKNCPLGKREGKRNGAESIGMTRLVSYGLVGYF